MPNPAYGKDDRKREEFAGKRGLEGPYHEYLKYLRERAAKGSVKGEDYPSDADIIKPKEFYDQVEGSGYRNLKEADFDKMLKFMEMFLEAGRMMPEPDAVEKLEDPYFDENKRKRPWTFRDIFRGGGSGY